jgi:uncharacterized protein YndB with AHSA1/START domain
MADIRNLIQIEVPAAKVYPFVCSGSGLAKWWAEDMTVQTDGRVELGFFNRATIYPLQLVRAAAPSEIEWVCVGGKEWNGTKLRFELSENKGQTALRFAHADWEAETDYFLSCNTTWGALMFRLKAIAEGKPAGPLFSRSGWSL